MSTLISKYFNNYDSTMTKCCNEQKKHSPPQGRVDGNYKVNFITGCNSFPPTMGIAPIVEHNK